MKQFSTRLKTALLCLSLLFIGVSTQASHLMGGEITCQKLTGNDYVIIAPFYRDTVGVSMAPTTFNVTQTVGGTFSTSTTTAVPISIYLGNGVERYAFVDTITFPGAGEFHIEATSCCRNAAILNMSSPGGETMVLATDITVYASPSTNSTPYFLNDPVTLAQVNVPFVYNPIPFDPNGDSLSWSLTTPNLIGGTPVAGYTLPPGSSPVAINAANGEITWTPNAIGNYVISVLVEEYRAGVKIGQIIRDMQILVMPSGGNATRAQFQNTSSWPTNANGDYEFLLPMNSSFSLTVSSYDPDLHPLSLGAIGEAMNFTSNPATFSSNWDNATGIATGQFEWTPDASQTRNEPYIQVFRTNEFVNGLQLGEDLTVLLYATNATGVSPSQHAQEVKLYPNPSSGALTTSFSLSQNLPVKVSVLDIQGRELRVLAEGDYPAGTHLVHSPDLNLRNGLYFLQVQTKGAAPITQKFILNR